MATPALAALWFLPFVLPIAFLVIWTDLSRMKIYNEANLALFLVFLVIGLFVLPFTDWAWRLTHLPIVLVIGFVLNIAGIAGGGDVKFAAAMAPFVAAADFVILMALMVAIIPASLITHRGFRAIPAVRRATPDWLSWERTKQFPMGLPLALTLVTYLVLAARG
jgi:prepilin peptidase CpaA